VGPMSDRPRVVVLDDYQRIALESGPWDRLAGRCAVDTLTEHVAATDALVAALEGAEVVVAMRERTPFDADRLGRLPDLRLLVTTGMGNAAIDLDAAARNGVVVCGTRGRPRHTVELTWGLILALLRAIPAEDARIRAGGWQHTVGLELAGLRLGVIGLGRLGSQVARIGEAFGMDVIAWSQNLDTPLTKEDLLRRSDIVTIHVRLSERTRGLIGAAELALMKPSALLINTSRGPIVDEAALVAALHAGDIAGAGLDVYDVEPLPRDHPLRSAPNTVLTPHVGYVTSASYRAFYADAVEDVAAFLRGEPIRVIN
jgi:phosphoglycerate dehydrogenase-like enzyme